MTPISDSEFRQVVDQLQQLIRIDTTNPPGNERQAIDFLARELRNAGLTPELVGNSTSRPNLVCRLSADSAERTERPLILSCHVDVVPSGDPSLWAHPPFSAQEADGCIWGRGAIDMKGFAIMALTTFRRFATDLRTRNRDIIFVAVVDEEAGTEQGSRWLVQHRPDLLGTEPEYVINEVGGFTVHSSGKRFYPVQVAEKGVAWLRMSIDGEPGHASLSAPDSAVARLSTAIGKIARASLPWHVSDEARRFLGAMAAAQGPLAKASLPLLFNSVIGPRLLPFAIEDSTQRRPVDAILHNTATPTVLRAGDKTNVLPSLATCEIDGRLAPGQSAENLVSELRNVVRDHSIEFEVLHTSPAVSFSTNTPLYRAICDTIKTHDQGSIPVPSIIPGFTDSHNFARLGADCYGFYPVQLPREIEFSRLFHGYDERIPIAGMRWGLEVLAEALSKIVY